MSPSVAESGLAAAEGGVVVVDGGAGGNGEGGAGGSGGGGGDGAPNVTEATANATTAKPNTTLEPSTLVDSTTDGGGGSGRLLCARMSSKVRTPYFSLR